MKDKIKITDILHIIIGTIVIMMGAVIGPINHYLLGLFLVLGAIFLYFYIVLFVAEKNWLDIRALFTGVWIATIGLASLRLLDYQEPWETATWMYNALAYFAFQFGAMLGKPLWNVLYDRIVQVKFKRISFKLEEKRLFPICITVTLIGVICFCINVYIRGFIPFFSSSDSAYLDFYTKFYLFAIATTMISGTCYYCIRTQQLSAWKKILLALCILYETFLFPSLVVSRGAFLTSALSLAAAIFYLHKKRLSVFILSMGLIMGTYMLLSLARGYTDAQLDAFFEPSKISLSTSDETKEAKDAEDAESDEDNESVGQENTEIEETREVEEKIFVLPSKIAFLYSYLTVSHDNFNEAVQNATEYTYGIRQLAPFNVILRISAIDEFLNEAEHYKVRPHLNTWNLIGGFYYDLRGAGIVFFMILWGCVFSVIQASYLKNKGPFALYALGNTMTPVVLCFFSTWISLFSHWMHWGTCWIIWVVACIHFTKRNKIVE